MAQVKTEKELKMGLYFAQTFIAVVLGSMFFNVQDLFRLGLSLVRYVFYLLLLRATHIARDVTIKAISNKPLEPVKLFHDHRKSIAILGTAAVLLQCLGELVFGEDFVLLFIADLICQYPEMDEKRPVINYGVGMACSYFEGYLMNIFPSDGGVNVGLVKNISIFEDREKVVFPVKKLFVVVTKSLYCPPNLEECNKPNRPDLAFLEACRVSKYNINIVYYRNSTYCIVRPDRPKDERVHVVAEFASPLNTFDKVMRNRDLYKRLCDVDPEEIKRDFCDQLERTVRDCPATKGKLQLVEFDDTDPDSNLADVLLEEIRNEVPNYEQIVRENAIRNHQRNLEIEALSR